VYTLETMYQGLRDATDIDDLVQGKGTYSLAHKREQWDVIALINNRTGRPVPGYWDVRAGIGLGHTKSSTEVYSC
jgi:hypothetical protein